MITTPTLDIAKLAAPLRVRVEDVLRRQIIQGHLAPGRRLTERELTEMTGVSRTLIREALRQLEAEGLIAVVPNKGAIVRSLTVAEARELYAIRSVLEGLAARLFVEHANAERMEEIGKAVDAAVTAYERGNFAEALQAKNQFYEVLFAGSGSETLSAMLATIHARIWRWRAAGVTHPKRSPGRAKEAARGLKSLLQALRKRDAAAAEQSARDEAMRGAAEIIRLIEKEAPSVRAARA
jgi:DNA-binding GntR family transcriptional regulator